MRLRQLSYPVVCTGVGLVVAWLPALLHGPVAAKFDLLYIRGDIAIWSFYSARLLVGFLVGITWWPKRWYVRGPMCGFLTLLPPAIVALATPGCGFT